MREFEKNELKYILENISTALENLPGDTTDTGVRRARSQLKVAKNRVEDLVAGKLRRSNNIYW